MVLPLIKLLKPSFASVRDAERLVTFEFVLPIAFSRAVRASERAFFCDSSRAEILVLNSPVAVSSSDILSP